MAYLPGQTIKPDPNEVCETHSDRPATHCIVGETDSFGSEFMHLCTECFTKTKQQIENPEPRNCDWCKTLDICKPMRDIDEGSSGPVYYVCTACRKRYNAALDQEIKDYYNDR